MTIRLHLTPDPSAVADDNGIGRIVHAQYAHLPQYGIEFVGSPDAADVTACHIEGYGKPVDVLHSHGLYYSDIPHEPYKPWHHEANRRIVATARGARAITVPSEWVARAFQRDMRLTPTVIGHGIDPDLWAPLPASERRGYALWAKSRASDVCSPFAACELAGRRIPVVTTFSDDRPKPETLFVIGVQPFEKMRAFIRHASVYLATTPETFGIQTLEAMAAGVPILGYRWAGTADLVEHGITGYLVEPGDVDGLQRGYYDLLDNWEHYSRNAAITGASYTWDRAMRAYADLYQRIAEEKAQERHRVCVVVTSYNYGHHLKAAVDSLLDQRDAPDEIVIVNDGSTDNTNDVALDALAVHAAAGVRYINQANQGVAAARNNGIAATDCEYVICLDADDQLAPDYIRVCRAALKADRALGIAYTGLGLLADDGRVTPSQFPPAFDWEHQATPGNPPRTCVPTAAMFRRSLWERAGGYRQVFAPGEDAEFYTRGLSIGYTARKVADEPYIWYRNHSSGASKTRPYFDYSPYHPWMGDRQYPMAAPSAKPPTVLSYARPLISVIIPCGPGHARYLTAALDSLLQQTYRQWEAIVIDDTGARLDADEVRITATYPFVKLDWTEGGPRGPGAARNLGLHVATAPLVLFLDADDWLADPDALRLMLVQQAKTGRYVYSDWVNVERGKEPWSDTASAYSQEAQLDRMSHAVTALIPTDWARDVGGFDETLRGWEDWDFFIKLAIKGHCGVRQPGALLGYRKDSGTQRDQAWHNRETLAPTIRERYKGAAFMACNCGPAGAAMLRIRQAVTEGDLMGAELQKGQTLMEYTGSKAGSTSVQSRVKRLEGRPVRYTYGGDRRLIPVWDEDIGFMESIGFRRALPGSETGAQAPTPESIGQAIQARQKPPQKPVEAPAPAPAQFAAERAASVAEEPAQVADVAEITAAFDQSALQRQTEEKAQQHKQRGRPRKQG